MEENEHDLYLLQVAALYHDVGYTIERQGHEMHSCKIARAQLPDFGIDTKDVDRICEWIMDTKIPQQPGDKYGMIICDADLDYLGSEEFSDLSEFLYEELFWLGEVKNKIEWDLKQINFLKNHQYFTKFAKQHRDPKKISHLNNLLEVTAGSRKKIK